jgi:class 3 adenylate cyclase/tetratricopeptide (TPR) repeat protein
MPGVGAVDGARLVAEHIASPTCRLVRMINCPSCGEENPPKFRLCGYCGAALAPAPPALPVREMRKTVTLIFSDLKDSTALGERLDSEALHEVKDRYFAAMSAEIKRHGGKIEKFIGDAIMAVFGLPKAHEDDALRAVRAAADMRKALVRVNEDLMKRYGVALGNRTGVNTGEVVANDDEKADQKLATGDAVNVAARLEQAAPVNEIYLGETTYQLVRDAVEVEMVEPLALKGKAEKVAAYRLVAARGLDGYARRQDTPIVGRDEELAALHAAYHHAVAGQCAHLVTVIGDAGLGKSRLVREVVDQIAAGARAVRGRCLPYGDGITFWPLVGMVSEAADIREDDHPDAARAKLLQVVKDPDVAARLASAIGLSDQSFPLTELYWGARKFLEGLTAEDPVVAVIDDIHWAEPAFLDLLVHILDVSKGAAILLLTTARHDLLETQPKWGERDSSTKLVLRPLSLAASAQVVTNLLGSAGLPLDVVERIATAAEGNPLYVEQMLSMLIDTQALRREGDHWVRAEGYGEIIVPPTIKALLEARLDNLPRADRATVEPASVIGLEFDRSAIEALAPDAVRPEIDKHLDILARKHFIDPSSESQAEAIYRFHHHLVRDTVYNGLLKRARANLHLSFVRWADKINADRDRALEFEAILGYHLEQAYRYLGELGPLDDEGSAIGIDAARRLSSAGKHARDRSDLHASANLLRRAIALLSEDSLQRAELLVEFGLVLTGLGDFAAAREARQQANSAAQRLSNPRIAAASQILGIFIGHSSGELGESSGTTYASARELIPLLERESAHKELASVWRLIVLEHATAGRYSLAIEASERSSAYARLAGDEATAAENRGVHSTLLMLGPMPVPQAIVQCEADLAASRSDRILESDIKCTLAQLKAMNGELSAARDLCWQARAVLASFGKALFAAGTGLAVMRVELHGGDLAIAEREGRGDYAFLEQAGETYYLSTMAALLSRVVRDQGRDEEALAFSRTSEQASAADDVESQALWRSIRAPILARAGDTGLAEEMARKALEFARSAESPCLHADVLSELACVLRLCGKTDEARQAIGEAIALYAAKGNAVSATSARKWAGELGAEL